VLRATQTTALGTSEFSGVLTITGIRGVATECLLAANASADPDGPTRAALAKPTARRDRSVTTTFR